MHCQFLRTALRENARILVHLRTLTDSSAIIVPYLKIEGIEQILKTIFLKALDQRVINENKHR